ncbi:hypothetical protein Trydic_g20670 [Trypoxylus dichotomus]
MRKYQGSLLEKGVVKTWISFLRDLNTASPERTFFCVYTLEISEDKLVLEVMRRPISLPGLELVKFYWGVIHVPYNIAKLHVAR